MDIVVILALILFAFKVLSERLKWGKMNVAAMIIILVLVGVLKFLTLKACSK